jgi:hypothetical protein
MAANIKAISLVFKFRSSMTLARFMVVASILSLNVLTVSFAAAQEPDSKSRRYEQGPLVKKDYQGAAPDTIKIFSASTEIEVRYDYRYQIHLKDQRFQIYVTDIEVYSIMLQKKSWNRQLYNVRLLDHEQGHFDIGEIFALKTKLEFAKQMKAKRRFFSVGKSRAAVIANLKETLNHQFTHSVSEMKAEQIEYDDATNHGLDRKAQKLARQGHSGELKMLQEKVKSLAGYQ